MRINRQVVAEQMRSKLTNTFVSGIVCEATIRALPFQKTELSKELPNINAFLTNTMRTFDCNAALESALANVNGAQTQQRMVYLSNLKKVTDDIVSIAIETNLEKGLADDSTGKEIIDNANFSSVPIDKIVEASKKAETASVAEVVKDVMIETIKKEKAAYDEAQKIKEDVKEIVKKESDDGEVTEETMESFLGTVLTPTDPRHHVSLFSKLQDICTEALVFSAEEYDGEIAPLTMSRIVVESTFPCFDQSKRDIDHAIDTKLAALEACTMDPAMMQEKAKKVSKVAFISTICIMTMLQTLSSMGLYTPKVGDVQNIVDSKTEMNPAKTLDLSEIAKTVNDTTEKIKKSAALGSYTSFEKDSAKAALENTKNKIDNILTTPQNTEVKKNIITAIESTIEVLDNFDEGIGTSYKDSYFTERLMNENTTNLEHAINTLAKNPEVKTVEVCSCTENKTAPSATSTITCIGKDISGNRIGNYGFVLHLLPECGAQETEVIIECGKYINPKVPVTSYITDKGYSVPLVTQ